MQTELLLQNVARRHELARRIEIVLRSDPRVVQLQVYGSMAKGCADQYSDIDLVVHLQHETDRAFAESLPTILQPVGSRLVDGWGVGFLPDTYVRTFYFDDVPLFWHVDIGCISATHVDGSDIKTMYHWPQIFKMWIDAVKDLLRGEDHVDVFATHIARWADIDTIQGDSSQRLSHYLDLCAARAQSRGAPFETLYERCDELRREFL